MASFGQNAAILNVMVRADTTQAARNLRTLDSTVTRSAANTKKLVTASTQTAGAQQRLGSAVQRSSGQMRTYTTNADKAGKETKELGGTSGFASSKLKSVGKAAAGAAAAYIGISQAKEAVDVTTDLAKATLTLHHNLGLSIQTSGAFAAEAKARDIDTNKLTMTTKTLAKAIEGAKQGTEAQVLAFKQLGISQQELKNQSMDKTLFAIADGAQKLGDSTQRTAALGSLFGRSFGPLRAIFMNGAAGMKELFKAVDDAGANIAKGKGVKGITELIAQQRQVKRETMGLQIAFTQELAPTLIAAMKGFGDLTRFVRDLPDPIKRIFNPLQGLKTNIQTLMPAVNAVIGAFRKLPEVGSNVWQKVKDAFSSGVAKIKQVISGLGGAITGGFRDALNKAQQVVTNITSKITGIFRTMSTGIRSAVRVISGPVVDAFHAIKDAADAVVRTVTKVISAFKTAASAPSDLLNKARDALPFAKGGVIVPGHGSGDTVPAVLEPGEVVWNKKAVQAMGGAKRANSINQAVPRFAGGGLVGSAQGITQGGTALMNAEGMALLVLLSKMTGGGNAAGLLKAAERMSAKHQPYLWGGGHAGFSRNGPWDCSGAVSQILHEAGFPISAPMVSGALASYGLPGLTSDGKTGVYANSEHTFMSIAGKGYGTSAENPGGGFGGPLSYNSRPGFAKRHPDMSHVSSRTGQNAAKGFQLGGVVQKFAGGGIAGYNRTFPRGGGPAIPFNIAAAIAESVGQPGITMAQVAKGESSLHPGAVSSDGGYGLWQMTPSVQSSSTVRAWNAIGSYFNPFKNAKMSKLLPVNGGTYHGSQYVTGWNQHYRGNIGRTKPTTKNKTPTPRTDPAGAGEPAWTLPIPKALTNTISSLGGDTGKIAEAAEFASRASEFGVPVNGKNEVQWILEELKRMEELREAYIAMILYIKAQIDKFQEAIKTAKKQLPKIKNASKRKALLAKIGKWTTRRDISKGALTAEEGPLAGLSAMQDPVAGKMFERMAGINLADKKYWGVFGGSVGEAQSSLKSAQELLQADTGSSGDTSAGTPDNSALIGLLQDQANKLAQQLFVSEKSYQVLAQTPYAGSFAKGGVVPGPTGAPMLATVHGGETISNGAAPVVVVVVEDGAVDARRIRAIAGKQAEQMARRSGRGRIPGRAGAL